MQPDHLYERHLIFKPYRKPGFLKPRPGGSQDVQAPEVQRLNKLLNGGLYYVQLVGEVKAADFGIGSVDVAMGGVTDAEKQGGNQYDPSNQSWRIEFKDIPDAGTGSAVTSRLISTSRIPYGDIVPMMKAWGYEYGKPLFSIHKVHGFANHPLTCRCSYVSEYVLEGDRFISDDTVLLLHRILNFPPNKQPQGAPATQLPRLEAMVPLDSSGGYVLQAWITVQDSGNPDLMKAASKRLLGLKEHLKSAVKLEPADRLSLDTRVK
ncbi:Mediator of RNA polymerase II transcription subunit 18 [Emydomyces testavorans]|uniref:Mediator of RNA polymerase II transcription subunit 18 n=1 Tax=Emydomyces testavorans TaxID=2070801 RepID=A0AAF0IEW0_9EURO|nr:Mediator of RNA polymerase II transcription subunit 18 [Emydomyces testavorans]